MEEDEEERPQDYTPAECDDEVDHSHGTRLFPRFDIRHPVFYHFKNYLMGVDGGEKGDKTAHEVSVDVSKYLRYACGSHSPSPDWSRLVDRDQLIGYMEKLKRAKVRLEGRQAKLDHLQAAMRFMKLHVVVQERDPLYYKFTASINMVDGWKKSPR